MVEYGKDPANEKNLVCCYTVTNHSSQSADITVLPQFWLLNARSITPNKYVLEIILTGYTDFVTFNFYRRNKEVLIIMKNRMSKISHKEMYSYTV